MKCFSMPSNCEWWFKCSVEGKPSENSGGPIPYPTEIDMLLQVKIWNYR
jgi:hypothetical protein